MLFARRGVVLPDGQHEQLAWLKAIGTGTGAKVRGRRQRRGLRVCRPRQGRDATPHPPRRRPPDASPAGLSEPASFTPAVSPSTSATSIRPPPCCAADTWRATASRRSGSTARTSPAAPRGGSDGRDATKESGEFIIHGGLQPGFSCPETTCLEIDVNNALPSGSPHCCGFGRR